MARRQRVYAAALQLVRARALKRIVPRLEMGRPLGHSIREGEQQRIEGEGERGGDGEGEGGGGKNISTMIQYTVCVYVTPRLLFLIQHPTLLSHRYLSSPTALSCPYARPEHEGVYAAVLLPRRQESSAL